MKQYSILTRLAALVVVLCMVFAGCTKAPAAELSQPATDGTAPTAEPTAEPSRPVKDTLTIAIDAEPPTLLPQQTIKYNTTVICHDLFSHLVRQDADGNIIADLAQTWENPDELHWVFHLREDVLWHDGEKFTADDVLYTFEVAKSQAACASHYATLDLENTKVLDDFTISVAFTQPNASFLELLATQRGTIICRHACEQMGLDQYARAPIGTGPYKFVNWVSGSSLTFERFDGYFGEPAKTKNLVYKIISDSAGRVIEVETGEADMAYSILASDVETVRADSDIMRLSAVDGYSYYVVTFNMQDSVVGGDASQKLREALAFAIDKDLLTSALYGDTAKSMSSILPEKSVYFKSYTDKYYDVEKAKQLLAEAGYPNGLHLEFLIQPTQEMISIAEAVQNMWKNIGVTTTVTTSEIAPYLAEGGLLQVSIRTGNMASADNTLVIYTQAFKDKINSNDDVLEDMLSKAKQTYGDEARAKAYGDISDYIWSRTISYPLFCKQTLCAVSNNVEGFVEHPLLESGVSQVVVYAD